MSQFGEDRVLGVCVLRGGTLVLAPALLLFTAAPPPAVLPISFHERPPWLASNASNNAPSNQHRAAEHVERSTPIRHITGAMTGARLPAVRMSQVVAGQEGEEAAEAVVVEIPSSSKFGFAWPAEQPSPAPLPLAAERPVTLSSSEGETDVSDDEPNEPVRRPRSEDYSEDSAFATPTNHLNLEQNPMDQAGPLPPQRRLSRAFSMPLPAQIGSLRNPRRLGPSNGNSPVVDKTTPEYEHFRELSLELADSVQMVIQTLLQLSPPQVFDPAKEQFSACSLSIPTPSICAMFTSMKNLNYMSANMFAFSSGAQDSQDSDPCPTPLPIVSTTQTDFDIGEMLQSAGDALSGVAAQAAVDLVLFHGDVGMKHIAVKGDETALSYTLSHVVRQVISVASPGDIIEIGLYVDPHNESPPTPPNGTLEESAPRVESPVLDDEGLLRCVFRIALRYNTEVDKTNGTSVADSTYISRPRPPFNTVILRRLLGHIGATLDADISLNSPSAGQACQLSVDLEPGEPSAVNPSINVSSEDAAILGYPDLHISNEPGLDDLLLFAETLRGKSVSLYASAQGSFAHHLSSYLTAWGMNVSHMSPEPDAQGEYEQWYDERTAPPSSDVPASSESARSTSPTTDRHTPSAVSFILIDDDVAVLRSQLLRIKAEQAYPLNAGSIHSRKRPSLAANHRPRSSPQVARVMGITSSAPPQPPTVIVHFTSLSNFKLVKDAIQSIFTPPNGFQIRIPEVIAIPKPAGPRRFLTALHTAVTRPVVDPFFVPTATSPMSPGLLSMSPFFNGSSAPKSPSGRSMNSGRASDRSARSPKEFTSELSLGHAPPSPLSQSEGIEYFSDAVVKLGATPSTGLIIQSPDGQPTGIFFHPKPRTSSGTTLPPSPNIEPTKAQEGREMPPTRHRSHRYPSGGSDRPSKDSGMSSSNSAPAMRSSHSNYSVTSEHSDSGTMSTAKGKGRAGPTPLGFTEDKDITPLDSVSRPMSPEAGPVAAVTRGYMIRRQSSHAVPTSPPASPQVRSPTTQTGPRRGRRMTDHTASSPSPIHKKGKFGASEGNIVPPISVLIVDDNPINQTILSTFMKKRRIKYDVAKNGEEAVDKWRSGTFHLILMDIQMPVMDGIQATKEIRRIEKSNAGGTFPSTPQSEGQRTPSEASTTDSRAASTPAYRSSVIIVALTASSLQADRVAALAAGCNDFLTKPVSLEWLNSKIIEWGSIKALQMWADIRPEVVRSITTGQAAQAQQVARRLHVPEGRPAAAAGGVSSRSSSAKRTPQEAADAKLAAEKALIAATKADVAGPSSQGTSEAANMLASVSTLLSNISAMSPSEAAMSLANAHRPHATVADVQIPTEAVVAAVETAMPSPSAAAVPAASETAAPEPPPLDDTEKSEDQISPSDDGRPPEPRQPDPQ